MKPKMARVWQYEEEGKRIFSFPFFGGASSFFLINFTRGKYQLLHNFIFTFSSTSRKESINFVTFLPSLFHQLHERKVPTSSHFLLHFFINFTKGKYQLLHNFIFTFSSTSRQVKHQLQHFFIFTFSSTSRKESTNFVTISSSLSHQLHERKVSTSTHFHIHFLINFTKGKYQLQHIFTFFSSEIF